MNDEWLRQQAGSLDAIHIHWPEPLWRLRGQSSLCVGGVFGLRRFLKIARKLELKRIFTSHNAEHHEGADWIDRFGYRVLARHSDLIICHDEDALEKYRKSYSPRGKLVPHGDRRSA